MTLVLMAAPFFLWWKAQALTDWWMLRGYVAPATVSALADQDSMTPYARRIFYVNHPSIVVEPARFRQACSVSEKTIILGCYRSNQNGVFIYDVQDQRLAGVEQVTAAHEMLHAAYDRLGGKQKSELNRLLQDYYQNKLTDQRIIQTINSYKQTEPNDMLSEMHSVFGTEASVLPAQLTNYYRKYFNERGRVSAYADNYETEFTSRETLINSYKSQLAELKTTINSREADLSDRQKIIDADRARLDTQRRSGQIIQYNAGVSAFNQEVDDYNNMIAVLKNNITQYNQLVDQYNAVAKELASLEQAIDSRVPPQQQQ